MGTPLAPYGLVGGKFFEPVCKPFRVYHVHPVIRGDSFTPVIVPVVHFCYSIVSSKLAVVLHALNYRAPRITCQALK